ncbi:hypothetical protein [Aquilutibacter rugosus]|uniref:hypothetical protein n=1 Tax=Aquilutibacter rugosus TaxID=3115820 RepID=UPI002F42DF8E
MLAIALVSSALQSYLVVGVLTCLILPRVRQGLFQALNPTRWRRHSKAAYLAFAVAVAASASVAWPWLLRNRYLQPAPLRL